MAPNFLLYGSTGTVGRELARLAVESGLQPIIAGRNAEAVQTQAAGLGVDCRVFNLDDPAVIDSALEQAAVVLNCAGPFMRTYRSIVESCLRTGTHYLDITGEIPVFEGLLARDAEAKARGLMILPAVGFDVAPTDCLALHLKERLPTANRLTLAFHSQGPAGFPPGSINTMLEVQLQHGARLRRDGKLVPFPKQLPTRMIDFGQGPVETTLNFWGDVFTAFYSTGIPNIEEYMVIPAKSRSQLAQLRRIAPLLRLAPVRKFISSQIPATSTPERWAASRVSIWGEVEDDQGRKAAARLHGPEGGVIWTSLCALTAVRHVLAGKLLPGFQTPALVFGADFPLECEGVTREELD